MCRQGTCAYDPSTFDASKSCEKASAALCDWASPDVMSTTYADCEFADRLAPNTLNAAPLSARIPLEQLTRCVYSPRSAAVFTDIDDTWTCSGGGFAGVMTDCAGVGLTTRNGVFPGVAMFMWVLSGGTEKDIPSRPIPFTARPRYIKRVLSFPASIQREIDQITKSIFPAEASPSWGLDVTKAVYGSMFADKVGHRTGVTGHHWKAYKKFQGFKQLYNTPPKENEPAPTDVHGSYFVGDNGQGDLQAAQMMMSYFPDPNRRMRGAFIHDAMRSCTTDECKAGWARHGIYLFSNYQEAACVAHSKGFITRPQFELFCTHVANCEKDCSC